MRHSCLSILLGGLCLALGCSDSSAPAVQPATTPRTTTMSPARQPPPAPRPDAPVVDWALGGEQVTSQDGRLSMIVGVGVARTGKRHEIVLTCSMSNSSGQTVEVRSPFADPTATRLGVVLAGPQGPCRYTGPTPSASLGSDSFVRMEPGHHLIDQTFVALENFADTDVPGKYTVQFVYALGADDAAAAARLGFDHLWTGKLASHALPWSNLPPSRALEKSVTIKFAQPKYTCTLAEAAAGMMFAWDVVVAKDIANVVPAPQDAGQCGRPGKSGLITFYRLSGNGQSYAISDTGLCPGTSETPLQVQAGAHQESFEWQGRNWGGPSDTSNPVGPPFPPGEYRLQVSAVGSVLDEGAWRSFKIESSVPVVLTP